MPDRPEFLAEQSGFDRNCVSHEGGDERISMSTLERRTILFRLDSIEQRLPKRMGLFGVQ